MKGSSFSCASSAFFNLLLSPAHILSIIFFSAFLKKGMILVCPISQKPVYRIMESISDGESVAAKHLFDIEANKPATPGQGAKCNSLLVGFEIGRASCRER